MEKSSSSDNPVIQIANGVIGPREPRVKNVKIRTVGDYPDVPKPYLEIASKFAGVLLAGPPVCDELMELVQHLFTEEEAAIYRYLKLPPRGTTARKIASGEHRPVDEVQVILDELENRHILIRKGTGSKRKYFMMPLFPGTMEEILFRNSLADLTDWHRRFAELFERLFETGYITDYSQRPAGVVRYLPVQKSIQDLPTVWPSDRLEEILDRYSSFAITYCQCRVTENLLERDCGRPMETCVIMGSYAETLIREGRMRRTDKQEVLAIKKEAEMSGLVSWMVNEESGRGTSVSCSCCGCCCHMMRIVTEFNMPSMIAPPHFRPVFDDRKCVYCGKCAEICTMGAITIDTVQKKRGWQVHRCVGCGLCALTCAEQRAIELKPTVGYRKPPANWFSLAARVIPGSMENALKTWWQRR